MCVSAVVSLGGDSRQPLAPARPKCNSILHMFGEWLFEAAHIGCEAVYHGKGLSQRSLFKLLGFNSLNCRGTPVPLTKSCRVVLRLQYSSSTLFFQVTMTASVCINSLFLI